MGIKDIIDTINVDGSEPNNYTVITKKVNFNFDVEDEKLGVPKIKIFGIGGAGNNIINFLEKLRG
jgi:cell division GTPase FtsZ